MEVNKIIIGDALSVLKTLPDNCVQLCCSSPPYYGLRSYLPDDHPDKRLEIGQEWAPEEYVEKLVAVFREVRRVLRPDGSLWLNLADSYAHDSKWGGRTGGKHGQALHGQPVGRSRQHTGLSPKNLIGIPWRVAFALQADGWNLRTEVIWHKPNGLPQPVHDRPVRVHEYLFLLSKSPRYYYDAFAVVEPASSQKRRNGRVGAYQKRALWANGTTPTARVMRDVSTRNRRTVWSIPTSVHRRVQHYAVMPIKLVEPCVLASSSPLACEHCGAPWKRVVERGPRPPEPAHRHPPKRLGSGQAGNAWAGNMGFRASRISGQELAAWRALHPESTQGWRPTCTCAGNTGSGKSVVLDPFCGYGTVALIALQWGRDYLGIELNPRYVALATERIAVVQGALWALA